MTEMRASLISPNEAEVHIPGTAGILICEYSGVTGEWTPIGMRIDGAYKPLAELDLPQCFTLNDEAHQALEALA